MRHLDYAELLARIVKAIYYLDSDFAIEAIRSVYHSHQRLAFALQLSENMAYVAKIITETVTSSESNVIDSIPFLACEEEEFNLLCGHLSVATIVYMAEGIKKKYIRSSLPPDHKIMGGGCSKNEMKASLRNVLQERNEAIAALSPGHQGVAGIERSNIAGWLRRYRRSRPAFDTAAGRQMGPVVAHADGE